MYFLLLILIRACEMYSYLLIGYALLSWFPQLQRSNLARFVNWLVDPMINLVRGLPLQFAGIDWSVTLLFIILNIGKHLLVNLLIRFM
ncbi:TPA: YggT family protein [Streptococcus suis]|nr:YggT family protein [Streptococcus suis]